MALTEFEKKLIAEMKETNKELRAIRQELQKKSVQVEGVPVITRNIGEIIQTATD